MPDILTDPERRTVERLKQTPLKAITRAEACELIDIIERVAPRDGPRKPEHVVQGAERGGE